jgi:hypothetical protein
MRAESGQGELHPHCACGWILFRDVQKQATAVASTRGRWLLQALHNFLAAIA